MINTMRFIYICLSLTFLVSCTKFVNVSQKNGVQVINDLSSQVYDADEISWKVGIKREHEVSQGFIFKVEITHLREEDIKELKQKYKIDSWIYQISKDKNPIGYVELPFTAIGRASRNFSIQVMYNAASASSRFRSFHCPAFGHRNKITKISEKKYNPKASTLYVTYSKSLKARPENTSNPPVIISAGTKLKGIYSLKVALFDSVNKKIFGQYQNLRNTIQIVNEEKIDVASCNGIKEEVRPLPSSKKLKIQDLEIK